MYDVCIHVCTGMMYVHVCILLYTCMYMYMYDVHVCIILCIYMYIYRCMYMYVYVHVHVYRTAYTVNRSSSIAFFTRWFALSISFCLSEDPQGGEVGKHSDSSFFWKYWYIDILD